MDVNRQSYLPVICDADAVVAWANIDNLASYIAAILAPSDIPANQVLNVPTLQCSQCAVVEALRRHCDRPASVTHVSLESAHRYVKGPDVVLRAQRDATIVLVDF